MRVPRRVLLQPGERPESALPDGRGCTLATTASTASTASIRISCVNLLRSFGGGDGLKFPSLKGKMRSASTRSASELFVCRSRAPAN